MSDSPAIEPPASTPPAAEGEPAKTPRRDLLSWATRGVYGACGAAVAWPVVRYVSAPLGMEPAGPVTDRAVRLADLEPGVPTLVQITGESVDAWTRRPATTVGRAWVVRTSPAEIAPSQAEVTAYSSVCPHAGCQVSGTVEAEDQEKGVSAIAALLCPCHGARFALDGEALPMPDGGPNPSPRGLDELTCELVEEDGDWWVEIVYQRFRPGSAERVEV